MNHDEFRRLIRGFYESYGRPMPWRETRDPYRIFVSEIMLQQTQVSRVKEKYPELTERFPSFEALAAAELRDVLLAWQGLGYNRRAKFLHRAAQMIVTRHDGALPRDPSLLVDLPGVGPNTAGSLAAFAYNLPVVFIETNIRRVFIHFFFRDAEEVHDRDILPLVDQTLDREDPRTWYYALMDYGAMLAKWFPNANRRSAHYSRQSPFENSDRQIRGRLLRMLGEHGQVEAAALPDRLGFAAERVDAVTAALEREGFLVRENGRLRFP
jgi:A/G-specific adenine glycosylase